MTWLIVAVCVLAVHAVMVHVRLRAVEESIVRVFAALAKWPGWVNGHKRQ